MRHKKSVMIGISIVFLIVGLVIAITMYNKSQLVASCVQVGSINNPFDGGGMQGEGLVTNDEGQYIYVTEDQVIEEVYVKVGDEVQVGDRLMAFDVSNLNATIEMQYLDLERYQKEATALKQKLQALKQTTPIKPQDETQTPSQIDGVYHRIESLEKINPQIVDEKKIYTVACFEDAYVLGQALNELVSNAPATLVFQINGEKVWEIDSESLFSNYDPTLKIKIKSRDIMEPEVIEPGMTQAEIQREIFATEQQIKINDIEYRKAQVELESLQKNVEDGIVYATVSGTVRRISETQTSHEPYLSIAGNEGLYLTGALNESMLGKVKVGDVIQATSWQTGMMYEAKIQSIDTYPSNNPMYQGNQMNETYYDFKAYIADAKDLNNGDYLSLTIDPIDTSKQAPLCIDRMYVREEHGTYYVMKDNDGKLKKQPVKVGKVVDGGYYIQVVEGISEDDYLAFPYGKTGVEGIKTKLD